MARNGALAVGYAWPALLAGFAVGSLFLAYFYFADLLTCGINRQVACLDIAAYFGFEGATYAVLAFLALRAVNRARAGRDMWSMRVYWPSVLGVTALVTLAAYLWFVLDSSPRGCDVGAWYVLYGCWDPGVTFLRVTVALMLTGLFTFGMAMAVRGPRAERAAPEEEAPAAGEEEETIG